MYILLTQDLSSTGMYKASVMTLTACWCPGGVVDAGCSRRQRRRARADSRSRRSRRRSPRCRRSSTPRARNRRSRKGTSCLCILGVLKYMR